MRDRFITERDSFAKLLGFPQLYEYIDHFSLFAGMHTIGNKIFTYEMLKKTIGIPGDIVEFGCWKGGNLLFLAKMISLLESNSRKKIIGFDNFSGLPNPTVIDGKYASEQVGRYKGDEDVLRKAINLFDFEEKVELVVGDALETIPQYQKKHTEAIFSFCYIDFDLYEPTKKALDLIDVSLSVGGVIAFDEALTSEWPGETIAMKEYLQRSNKKYMPISNTFSKQPTMALIRVE